MNCLLLFLLAALPARADLVTLGNGTKLKGIVIDTDAQGVEFQVDEEGFVFLDTTTALSVQHETPQQNKELKLLWRSQRSAQEKLESDARIFAAAQRAKGLSLYGSEWLPDKEVEQKLKAAALEQQKPRREQPNYREGPAQLATLQPIPIDRPFSKAIIYIRLDSSRRRERD